MTKHQYLTLSDRNDIQLGLERAETFKAIGQLILQQIEIRYEHIDQGSQINFQKCFSNHGVLFQLQSAIKDPTTVSKKVKRNRQVQESTCDNLPCPLLAKAPFVCNGCPKRRQNCGHQKIFYLAKQAQQQYEQTLVEAREGTPP